MARTLGRVGFGFETFMGNLTNHCKSWNVDISFGTNTQLDPTKCAEAFCRQFVKHPTKPDKNLRVVKRKICTLVGSEEISFSANDVLTDIKTAKPSIAIGSDGLATIMLKHLGMKGLEYLARTYNLCMNTLDIPTMWKLGKIIAVPKSGKPLN